MASRQAAGSARLLDARPISLASWGMYRSGCADAAASRHHGGARPERDDRAPILMIAATRRQRRFPAPGFVHGEAVIFPAGCLQPWRSSFLPFQSLRGHDSSRKKDILGGACVARYTEDNAIMLQPSISYGRASCPDALGMLYVWVPPWWLAPFTLTRKCRYPWASRVGFVG
jgi:hypothetical protein